LSTVINDETGGHGGDLAAALKRWNPSGGELVDFSSNINPLGPPPGLVEHLAALLPQITAYPTPQARELREKISTCFNVPVERLLLGNGANEMIHLIMLWRRPRRVLIPAPSFSEYERAAKLTGTLVETYPLPPGEVFKPELVAAMLEQGDLLVFCNPNNPTGRLYRRTDLLSLVKAAEQRGAMVMIDESFIPLTAYPEESLRDLHSDHLWVVVSLTKIWGLPGLRLGFAAGPAVDVTEISCWGDPWRVNFLAQRAGVYCIDQKSYITDTLKLVEQEREFLTRRFQDEGYFEVFDGAANYLLLKGKDPEFHVAGFQEGLARKGVLIRRADNFRGLNQRFMRIAVKQRPDNLRLLQETAAWFENSSLKTARKSPTGGKRR
jgi:threonine-phosphate decarboxylase